MNKELQYTIPNEWLYEDAEGLHVSRAKLVEHFLTEHHYVRVGNTELLQFNGKKYVAIGANDCKCEIKQHIPLDIRVKKNMDDVFNELITEPLIPYSNFNTDETIINMQDAVLHLDTMMKTPHSPDRFVKLNEN